MITISAVPTRTPMPIVATNRNRDWERANVKGRDPAKKDLGCVSVRTRHQMVTSTHAIAIIVVNVSSMSRPSNIVTKVPP